MSGRRGGGWHGFLHLWTATVVSAVGSHLTGFALGVWIYRATGSTTMLGMLALCGLLPCVLAWPLAGAIVDRIGPERALAIGQAGAGASMLSVAVAAWSGEPSTAHALLAFAVCSLFESLEYPALAATLSLRVAPPRLSRGAALAELGHVLAQLLSPMLGAVVLAGGGLGAVLAVDLATFATGLALLAIAPPAPARAAAPARRARFHVGEVAQGWRFVRRRRPLLALVAVGALANLVTGFVQVLATPLVLGIAGEAALGVVLSLGGVGLVIGSALAVVAPPPARPARLAIVLLAVQGGLLVVGAAASVAAIAIASFGFALAGAAHVAYLRAVWQRVVPGDVLGRVAAIRATLIWLPVPAAHALAGPLTDHVLDPLVAASGPLAGSLGAVVGVGPGRGGALLFLVAAAGLVAAAIASLRSRWLRDLDRAGPEPDEVIR